MRKTLNDIYFKVEIVIGEGEKDKAPMLFSGEIVGLGKDNTDIEEIDIAVDPLECTTNLAMGKPNAMSVLAAGPKGTLLTLPGTYMDQIAVGKKAVGTIDLKDTVENNLQRIAEALDKDISEVTVCILERPRLQKRIDAIRKAGARIRLIEHGTVGAAIATSIENSGIDVLMGDGGAPETVIVAAALKCIGGEIQAILKPHDKKTISETKELGYEGRIFHTDELAKGDEHIFVATGVSDGPLLKGVVFKADGAITNSIAMRSKSGTIRVIKTKHVFDLMPSY